jgi:putative DNA primase/helicase
MSNWDTLTSRYPALKGRDKGMVKCVCHNDRMASLSVKKQPNGDVLLHCFAGCPNADVREALGLIRMGRGQWTPAVTEPPKRRVVCEYRYRDLAGDVLAIKQRWALPDNKKTFTWLALRADGKFGMSFPDGMSQHDLPLYKLPECVALTRQGQPLLVVEGEKDVDNLHALGFAATTHPSGASGAGSAYEPSCYVPYFPPHKVPVCLIPDNDEPGRKHARRLSTTLGEAGYIVKVLTLPDLQSKGDVTDWIEAQRLMNVPDDSIATQLAYMVQHAPVWTPADDPSQPLPDAEAELERAAILEHDAGYTQADAERIARHDVRQVEAATFARLTPIERAALATDDAELAAVLRDMRRYVA